jgi:hypothetical protein
VVEERFTPGTIPAQTCEEHDDQGDLVLPARYAEWVRRTHPVGIARTFQQAVPSSEQPVVREPRDGARWLLDPGRGTTTAPLRAAVGGMTVEDVRWEVDGVALAGPSWEIRPGDHDVVAVWQGRRSRPARVHVERGREDR